MVQNSLCFRRGNNFPSIVFIGACPGKREYCARPQRPFSGNSGKNLRVLLGVLRGITNKTFYGFFQSDFQSIDPDDYTLMNSHAVAKWKIDGKGRTTPTMSEVEDQNNINRLAAELNSVNARVVIGLGRPTVNAAMHNKSNDSGPMRVIRLLKPQYKSVSFCITGHPSPQAINVHGGGDAESWFRTMLQSSP